MTWKNGDLILYHGCTDKAASAICTSGIHNLHHNIDLTRCHLKVDFGQGFYTTTREDQARNWANAQYIRNKKDSSVQRAAVIAFVVNREAISKLQNLSFVWEGADRHSDFWTLVKHCRQGNNHSHSTRRQGFYDCASGPVALPNQLLVVKDCDQFSFHTQAALDVLQSPTISYGSPKF